jgi:hypothetical protein
MFELENLLSHFDDVWYGYYATGGCPKIASFFPVVINTNMLMHELARWKQH